MAKHFDEATMLRVGLAVETNTEKK
jgi:hypothetical protein